MKKIIIISILLLIGICLILGFLFYGKPKSVQAPASDVLNQETSFEVYKNDTYGFEMTFPITWKNYSAIKGYWQGNFTKEQGMAVGPMLTFRNPNWKENEHWQDIPVMIFAYDAWELVEKEEISLGAAPVGPSEIGRNAKWIFATPARWYGFTSDKGQEEAVAIVKTFKANDSFKK